MLIAYRPAIETDYDFCKVLHHQGMRPYVEPLWGWKDDFQNERYKRLWGPTKIRIIQHEDKDIGYIEISKSDETTKLVNVFVTEELRGKGIGTQVISDFISQYRTTAPKLTLNVLWNNPAIHLYERLGFKLILREDHIMKYELCF